MIIGITELLYVYKKIQLDKFFKDGLLHLLNCTSMSLKCLFCTIVPKAIILRDHRDAPWDSPWEIPGPTFSLASRNALWNVSWETPWPSFSWAWGMLYVKSVELKAWVAELQSKFFSRCSFVYLQSWQLAWPDKADMWWTSLGACKNYNFRTKGQVPLFLFVNKTVKITLNYKLNHLVTILTMYTFFLQKNFFLTIVV